MRSLDARTDVGASFCTVSCGGRELLRYVFRPDTPQVESPRPYFHPVTTLAGTVVTQFRPADHPWHHGLAFSLAHVDHENFWGGPTYVGGRGYQQLANNGTVRHVAFEVEPAADVAQPSAVDFTESLEWVAQDGRLLLDERRRVGVRLLDDAWVLLFETSLRSATGDPVTFGSPGTAGRSDAGYGGLFWRGAEPFVGGTPHTAVGTIDESFRGETAGWVAYSSSSSGSAPDSRSATLVMLDHEANPRHEPPWFMRTSDYAGLNPAPFFRDEFALAPAATLTLAYAVVVADASATTAGAVADLAAAGRAALARFATIHPASPDPINPDDTERND